MMSSKPAHRIIEDAVAIRGILDLFEESETITTREAAMTQHISDQAALRLMRLLQKARVIEHPTATRIILGVPQEVPCIGWRLTEAARQGKIPSAGYLAMGSTA